MTYRALKEFFCSELQPIMSSSEADSVFHFMLDLEFGISRLNYRLRQNEIVADQIRWFAAISRLKTHEPVQYVVGKSHFFDSIFTVSPAVLIPRPETEELVDLILKSHDINKNLQVLDIGTGSGCIAISLQKNRPNWQVKAIDISAGALAIAKQNAQDLKVEISLDLADIIDYNPASKFDIIVSNPPYIPENKRESLHENVLHHEPHIALFAPADDDLYYFKVIASFAQKHLNKPNGTLYFETHYDQALRVAELFDHEAKTEIIADISGVSRMVKITF